MNKIEYNPAKMKMEIVKYGKRYGYWWKKHREIARKIIDYNPAIDYFYDLEYRLDKPMTYKHLKRWLKL